MEVPFPPTIAAANAADAGHAVVVPYPSRGHINPMMNLCKLLVSKNTNILVTFVVTEEWLGFIGSEPKPDNVRLASVPNVMPPEQRRSGNEFLALVEAVMTKMEAPLEQLLNRLEPPPTIIICDAFLFWAVAVGNRRNIPVASFWTTSTSEFWVQHYHLFQQKQHCPQSVLENGEKLVDYIPGVSWIRLADIPLLDGSWHSQQTLQWALKGCQWMLKTQYLLFPSIYELEPQVIDAMKASFSIPIYTIGPNIPVNFSLGDNSSSLSAANYAAGHSYLDWLDRQPSGSVLYISHGSFLSVSGAQVDEMAAGLRDSGVRFLWVMREEGSRLKEICGNKGLVLAWCDQLRLLLHPAVGGFWTHCGWNSIMEGVFAGVPFLTFPLAMDQPLSSRLIVDDWKVGWRVKKEDRSDTLVRKDEIAVLLKKFMQLDSDVGRDTRKRAKELQRISQLAIANDGSSETNIRAFLKNIRQSAVPQGSNRHQGEVGIENHN